MVARCRKWLARRVVLLLAVSVPVVTSCSAAHQSASTSVARESVAVSSQHGGSLSLGGGLRVTVPPGSVAGAGRLTGDVVHAPAPAPGGLAFAGQAYHL